MNQIGIKNAITSKTEWKYLSFYDFDKPEYSARVEEIKKKMVFFQQSYILRTTLNGMHLAGLTPNTATQWGMINDTFQKSFPAYHDGQVLRITPKPKESMQLLEINLNFPFAVNPAKIILRKMGLDPAHYFTSETNMLKKWWYILIMYNAEKTKKTERYMMDGESKKAAK